MLRTRILLTAAALLLACGCNRDHKTSSSTMSGSRTYSTNEPGMNQGVAPDTAFLQDAAMGGKAEVELSNIAVRQSSRQEVRDFAQQMVDDHTKLNNQVMELAGSRDITLPSQPDTKHRQAADQLMNMQGADFDRQYLRLMIDDHEQTITKFESRAQNATDPQVRSLASQALPTIRHHLDMARQVMSQIDSQPGAKPPAAGR